MRFNLFESFVLSTFILVMTAEIFHFHEAKADWMVGASLGRDSLYLGHDYKEFTPSGYHYGIHGGWWSALIGAEVGLDRVKLERTFVTSGIPVKLNVRIMSWYAGGIIPFFTPFTYLRGGLTFQKYKSGLSGTQGVDEKTKGLMTLVNGSDVGYYIGLGAQIGLGPWQIFSHGSLYKPEEMSLFQWALGARTLF